MTSGSPIGHMLSLLDKVTKLQKGGWVARCPAHQDKNPSLKIDEGTDGRVLLYCHAGCSNEQILDALRLTTADLFEPREQDQPRTIEATYDYVDSAGELAYQAVRFKPKDFRQRRPDGNGGWIWDMKGTKPLLYRLPNVLEAITAGTPIYVAEGEKDVAAIEQAGGVATTNHGGAGKWQSDHSKQLAGAQSVTVVSDNDEPGLNHATKVAASLLEHKIKAKIVLPATGKDAADHIAAGHSLTEFITRIPGTESGWQRINLADPQYAIPPEPPIVLGLLYKGKRHVLSGPPESTKTLIAYAILMETLRSGRPVAIVDFEMGPTAARTLLQDLGATLEEIAAIYYVEPEDPPSDYQDILDHHAELVLIDAAAGAYDVTGLDDNARKDAERFASQWIKPLWQAKVATLLIDHVTKDSAARGKFTIGSERKVGQADIHLSLEALKPLSRGGSGIVKTTVHKDRPGFLSRPTAVVIELESDPDTHQITLTFRDPVPTDQSTGEHRYTIYMERVSRYLEPLDEPAPLKHIEEAVIGNATYIRKALDSLVSDVYVAETKGSRGARLFASIRQFRKPEETTKTTSSDVVPRSSENVDDVPRPAASPLRGADEVGRGKNDLTSSAENGRGQEQESLGLDDDGIPF